ncbi:hypothetical protein [Chitinophaga silvisoli]|nr:hypothetical protein [Chitinophaga silvisoli]
MVLQRPPLQVVEVPALQQLPLQVAAAEVEALALQRQQLLGRV